VAVVTDARFSGVSTGACIGHVSPEALAGGAIGRLRDGDPIEIVVDRGALTGTLNYVGPDDLASREPHPDLRPDPRLPDHTRLWAALQDVSGGTWGGAVYDTDAILKALAAGSRKLGAD
jgi:dihydroxyacid dehydratase/phosphogluconate dehydratase